MLNKIVKIIGISLLFLLILSSVSFGRTSVDIAKGKDTQNRFSAVDAPSYCIVNHRVGNIVLAVKNNGTFGIMSNDAADCLTGDALHACEYPKNSRVQYLFGAAFWIGAVVGRDTLVSTGADGWTPAAEEFNPDISPFGDLIYRSIRFPDEPNLFNGAVSEEDYIAVYSDTLTAGVDNDASGRPHRPLNIEVTQRSFAWSYPYAEDFVLFDYEIKNIGVATLRSTYMGIYVDADVQAEGAQLGYTDDICGFIETFPSEFNNQTFLDTVNIAWIADNDGDKGQEGVYTQLSTVNVTATRIVRTPADSLDVSFNWWVSNGQPALDFGPRERAFKGKWQEDFRNFRTGTLGTASGDADKYYQLRNREFDYDQILVTKIQPADTLWTYPPQELADDLGDGYDTRYLLSFGPFDINPGEKLPISFAYLGGMNLHTDENNFDNNLAVGNPIDYYNNLDFSDLAVNSVWASRVYDNPGVDTDGDNYFGKFRYSCSDSTLVSIDTIDDTTFIYNYDYNLCDTLFYEGDGVPDFRGASPPPPPDFWVTSDVGEIEIRFNGRLSETTVDVFSRIVDFEGYRVYLGLDERESSFSMIASFDRENYNKLIYNENRNPEAGYELRDMPFTIDELRASYGAEFSPLDYTRSSPFIVPNHPESLFYFEKQDFNAFDYDNFTPTISDDTPIRKIYPDEPYPSSIIPDSAQPEELTADGYLRYFEYQMTITDLLPTVEWWVNVTAFDFGSPESGLPALETAKSFNAQSAYALSDNEAVVAQDKKVYVYPNPYRFDGEYREKGFEARIDFDRAIDRTRNIHFVNLPPICTIRIYSLDGDLIREIEHDVDPSDPKATQDTWDLITRNTQLTVSGVYYWSVESDTGETQIGKLVIIM